MAWLESHQTVRDHPKKDKLSEILFNGSVQNDVADYAAAGLLHYLWYWALDYAQDGDLAKFSDRQIAKGCRWNGDAKLLVQAFIEAGFIDKDRSLHDWDEYAGRLLAKRAQDRDRKAKWREHAPSDAEGAGQDADAPRDGQSTNRPTNLKRKERISSRKGQEPVDKSAYCPDDGATIQPDGHCPVCQRVLS